MIVGSSLLATQIRYIYRNGGEIEVKGIIPSITFRGVAWGELPVSLSAGQASWAQCTVPAKYPMSDRHPAASNRKERDENYLIQDRFRGELVGPTGMELIDVMGNATSHRIPVLSVGPLSATIVD